MPGTSRPPAVGASGPDPSRAENAVRQACELSDRLARLTDAVADSEEMVAKTYEDSARLRPHAAERLQGAAQDARNFTERERAQGRRLREGRAHDDEA